MQKLMRLSILLLPSLLLLGISLLFSQPQPVSAEEGKRVSLLVFLDQNSPLKVGKQSLHFQIKGKQVKPKLSLRIFMKGHAMMTDHKIVHLIKKKDGNWSGRFSFMMGGDWVVEALLLRRNGAPVKERYTVHVLWK